MALHLDNTLVSFVYAWKQFDECYWDLTKRIKRYSLRNVFFEFYDRSTATEFLIWECCFYTQLFGYNLLPRARDNPFPIRSILIFLTARTNGISFKRVNLKALDTAYSIVYPKARSIDTAKKGLEVRVFRLKFKG